MITKEYEFIGDKWMKTHWDRIADRESHDSLRLSRIRPIEVVGRDDEIW